MDSITRNSIIRLTSDYLLKKNITQLPIRIGYLQRLLAEEGFQLYSYENGLDFIHKLELQDNLHYPAFTISGIYNIVFYDDRLSVSQKNLYIAHELGHIVLGHIRHGVKRADLTGNTPQEQEADTFAHQLLAPACILKYMKINNMEKIATATLLEQEQAAIVLHKLRDKNTDKRYLRKELLQQFSFTDKKKTRRKAVTILFSGICAILTAALCFMSFLPKSSTQVYITQAGTRYHKAGCFYLSGTKASAVPLSECTEYGYLPCSYCFDE